jgi:3-dehydroquinate synthase
VLKTSKDKLGRLEFKMKSSIDREVSFYWADVKQKISNDWGSKKVVAFIDSNVYEADSSWLTLEKNHSNFLLIPTNLGESTKQTESLLACLERIESIGFSRRDDILIAIGGGVLMDLVSLAANLYRRGVAVVKVPTTLLGFVDASIGIKTGINFMGQRNRLGTYYLNYDVLYDRSLLGTLNIDHLREGLGEIFKIAIIKSRRLFELLEKNSKDILDPLFYQTSSGAEIIGLSVQLMLEELHENPTETNLKRCVDFGHSFSPLVEMRSIKDTKFSEIPHGLAVGADCIITSIIARNRGILSAGSYDRILSLGKVINFISKHPIYKHNDIMWSSLVDMTEHRGGNQNLPYPTEIGKFDFIQDLDIDELRLASDEFRRTG